MQLSCVRRSKMKLTEWQGEANKFPQFQFTWAFTRQMVYGGFPISFLCVLTDGSFILYVFNPWIKLAVQLLTA